MKELKQKAIDAITQKKEAKKKAGMVEGRVLQAVENYMKRLKQEPSIMRSASMTVRKKL